MTEKAIPSALFSKRMHSLMGVWLTIYLMLHLFTNSQAAYFFGENGTGFIHAVNSINDLPYLPIIELLILAVPILVHMILGIKYLRTAKYNSFGTNTGTEPYLPQYNRNKAYTWQRITSYLLVIGIIAHIVHMRFVERPLHASIQDRNYYMVVVNLDEGIYTLAQKLDVQLYTPDKIKIESEKIRSPLSATTGYMYPFFESMKGLFTKSNPEPLSQTKIQELLAQQKIQSEENFIRTLEKYPIIPGQAIAVSKDFGTAELMMLRETFKIPIMIALYTIFVLSACFHAFNGLWTALISWGIPMSERSRNNFLKLSYFLMFLFAFLGLSAIYATYWINLKQ